MPGNTCRVCGHAKRKEIDQALLKGGTKRQIAIQYGSSPSAISRHCKHLPKKLAKVVEVREAIYAGALIDQIRALYLDTCHDWAKLRDEGNYELALRHASTMLRMLELQGKILGELKDGGTAVNMSGPVTVTVNYQSKTLIASPLPMPFLDAEDHNL